MNTNNHKITLDLGDLARSGHVTRWHSVRTYRDQTLAEHHYMVAMIANKLAKDILGESISDNERLKLLEYALWHDMPEIIMGDISSPCKNRIKQICGGKQNPIDQLENEVAPWLVELKKNLNPELVWIVKLGDLIDAILFISQEGIGKHAEIVKQGLEKSFEDKIQEACRFSNQFDWSIAKTILNRLLQNEDHQIEMERYLNPFL
ncbi:MAG: HD domain-containing protein [Proteobacteria bacterium]|nr:HD domain-containing protein [Pseudomonadota bacterium]